MSQQLLPQVVISEPFSPLFKGRQGPGKTGEGHVPPGQYLPFSSTCKTLWTPTTASQMEAEAQSWPRKQHPNPRTGQPSNRATVALWEMDLKFNNGNSIQKLVVSSPPLGSGSSFFTDGECSLQGLCVPASAPPHSQASSAGV